MERQQRDGQKGHALRLVARQPLVRGSGAKGPHPERGDRARLRYRRGDEDEGGLNEERGREGPLGLGPDTARLAEEEAARPEADDGDEGPEPEGLGGEGEVCRAEGEEDCVAWVTMSVGTGRVRAGNTRRAGGPRR